MSIHRIPTILLAVGVIAGSLPARADDASAIFYNPAGITELDGWQVLVGTSDGRLTALDRRTGLYRWQFVTASAWHPSVKGGYTLAGIGGPPAREADTLYFGSQLVHKTTDRGETWEKTSDYTSVSSQYYNELIADPVDVDTVYSMDTWLHHTVDGGKTWSKVGEDNKHVDNHAMWINPADTDHWVVGCDGGAYLSQAFIEARATVRF